MTIVAVARRLDLPPVADSAASEIIGTAIGPALIGFALRYLPDGVIFMDDVTGEFFESCRMELKPIQRPEDGTVTSVKREDRVVLDAEALAREILWMIRAFASGQEVKRL